MTERENELEIRCGSAKFNIEATITMATMLDKDNKVARGILKITKGWLQMYAPDSHSIKVAEKFLNS